MTLCKQLASKEKNGITVTAWEQYDKFSSVPHYTITVSKAGERFCIDEIKTAKTTWKKRFQKTCAEYGIS